jgi:nitrogen-specific signal transduction histidine kinase/CheY-like chemotaxis protein
MRLAVSEVQLGHRKMFAGIVRDLSQRKQLEEQLLQSQKIDAIGQLAGGVAHDFNNLLTVIIGYAGHLLFRLDGDEVLCRDVEQINKAGLRAASLTRQLLAFSRRQVLQPSVLNLNVIVADLEKMLRRLIGEDVKLVTALERELGHTKADPGQIEQVIMNLVVNARDAMPQGGILTIETTNVYLDGTYTHHHVGVTPGPYIMLAVSDTGYGMDAETRLRVFEPFFTTKKEGHGTGLGLATVYGIINQSQGHIWVYSEPGQGTTFKIYLPRVETVDDSATTEQELAESMPGSETVLLVEDDSMVRRLTHRVLLDNGYTVLPARYGPEAIKICEAYEDPIHLLITDIVLPGGMNGRESAERLTLMRPEMKVLYMSGYTENTIVKNALLDTSQLAFLQKPFTLSTLTRNVREVLDGE